MHAADLARACAWALFHYDAGEPLIVAGEEVSVRHLADLVCQATGLTGWLAFDGEAVDGPLRRTADTKFAAMWPGFAFQPLLQGNKDTVAWYEKTRVCGGDGGGGGATAHVQVAQRSFKLAAQGVLLSDATTGITAT